MSPSSHSIPPMSSADSQPASRPVPQCAPTCALVAVAALVPALAGCAGALTSQDALQALTGAAFAEQRLVAHTCDMLRVDDPARDLAGLPERASPAVMGHLVHETEAVLAGAFGALGVAGTCEARAVVAARLEGAPPPEPCATALAASLASGDAPFARVLRAELPGVRFEAGGPEVGSLARAAAGFLSRPGYWTARFDLSPALVQAGVQVADGAERLVDELVSSLPYIGGLVQPLAREATAEIVAYAFDGVLRLAAHESALGPASLARAACTLLAEPRGSVAERLLRRTVLRFEPSQWQGAAPAGATHPEQVSRPTKVADKPVQYPIGAACEVLARSVPDAAAFVGQAAPCEAVWSAIGERTPWQPALLVPTLADLAPSAENAPEVVRRNLELGSAGCSERGHDCPLSLVVLRASLVAIYGQNGASLADVERVFGPLLARGDEHAALVRRLEELAAELADERRAREASTRELLGYVKRFGACDEVNRRARAERFAALVRAGQGGDLCTAPGLEKACAAVDKLPADAVGVRGAVAKESAPLRVELESVCSSAPQGMVRSLWRSPAGKRSAELVVDTNGLCALDATTLTLGGRGALFDLGRTDADADTRATLGALRQRFETVVRALAPSAREVGIRVVVDGRVSEEGASAMPDQRALANARAARSAELLAAGVADGPASPAGAGLGKDLTHFEYVAGRDPDIAAVALALRSGKGPCQARGLEPGSDAYRQCVEGDRGVRLSAALPEDWYPCPRVEAPR